MDIETVITQLEYWHKYGQETGNFQYNVYTNARDMLIKFKSERDEALKKLSAMESQAASADKPAALTLDSPARVNHTVFGKGVFHGTVVDAAKRYYQHMQEPQPDAEALASAQEEMRQLMGKPKDDKPARITEQDVHDKNSQRYLWIKENIQEEPTQESLRDGEYAEHKTCYKLPLLIAWADFCGHISLDDAIDNKISLGDSCPSHEKGE